VTNLEKLDTVLNVPIGHMRELLQKAINRCAPAQNNEYRDRLRVRCADPYKLKPAQLNEQFKLEWASLMKHKCTTGAGSKQRHANGRWSVTGNENAKEAIAGITTFEGKHFASAGILWIQLSAFFGFLQRPKSDGGWGLAHEVVQSLGWLADSEAIDAFLDFQTKRSAGLIHKGHSAFCTNIASLTHPEHGFLTQTPEMMGRLPHARTEGRSWREHCEAARHTAGSWKSASVDVSRDPVQPIRFLLDQPHPLLPVFTAMQRLREIGNAAPAGSKSEACARRDELLLGILLSNPLRRKNIIELTVSPDNRGSVYQTASGEWRIRLSRSDFKNGKTATRKARTYDVRLAPWLAPLMSDYVTHFRPVLGDHSTLGPLFLSKNGGPLLDMTHRVLILTRQLIPGCGGFGPHAFRHLVATDWLRRNPNDFLTVAQLLNDSLEVVLETYAHLKQDDALTRHSDQLADLMPTYLKLKS
jgi:integrase